MVPDTPNPKRPDYSQGVPEHRLLDAPVQFSRDPPRNALDDASR